MNIDDPKLTAFALGELEEPERSTIAREVAQSPDAQRVVDETRELARALKNEFAAELNEKAKLSQSLTDIRDDPWFWSIGRPLAVAAVVAIFAVLGTLLIGTYSRRDSGRPAPTDYTVLEGEEKLPAASEFNGPPTVPNPLSADTIKGIERVVVGEIDVDQQSELRVIETISDAYRIERLKGRLSTPIISKETNLRSAERGYGLIFLDRDGHIVASARFCRAANWEFVLRPLRNAYERGGRYFIGGAVALPGDWRSDVDYDQYVIQLPDWGESIGYAPGA
jgi:hypothetical protein